jgi:glycosyltransferase involved in cell wall biosynthesis
MSRKILYVRNGPYKVNPNLYNLQEIGFCKELCKRGFDCDIIYYSDENKDETIYSNNGNNIKLLWRKGYKVLRTGLYPKLLKKEFVNQYDLIITTEYSQIMSLFWTKFNPRVVLYNGPYYNLFKIPFTEKIYDFMFVKKLNKNIDKTFTKSKLATEYLIEKGFENIETLGVGLDTSVFENENELSENGKKIVDYMMNNKCLLYVGSLEDRKNFMFTLNVLERINRVDPYIKLVVIGKGKESYVKKCFESINRKTRENILHINQLNNKELKYIYPNAKVFILPSKLEIFGMVLLEAMYFGAPTITSVNGGSTTLIESSKNGVIMKGFNKEEWATESLKLINEDKYRNEISENAKKTIENKFTWEKICNKFIDSLNLDN